MTSSPPLCDLSPNAAAPLLSQHSFFPASLHALTATSLSEVSPTPQPQPQPYSPSPTAPHPTPGPIPAAWRRAERHAGRPKSDRSAGRRNPASLTPAQRSRTPRPPPAPPAFRFLGPRGTRRCAAPRPHLAQLLPAHGAVPHSAQRPHPHRAAVTDGMIAAAQRHHLQLPAAQHARALRRPQGRRRRHARGRGGHGGADPPRPRPRTT